MLPPPRSPRLRHRVGGVRAARVRADAVEEVRAVDDDESHGLDGADGGRAGRVADSAISPKNSPGPRVTTGAPRSETSTVPVSMT